MEKICSTCGVPKHPDQFGNDKSKKDGKSHVCKNCHRTYLAGWKQRNKNTWYESARSAALKNKFGITAKQYDEMLAEQGGVCAICKQPPGAQKFRFAVDHWHSTGDVRGILCNHCNRGLGAFYDNPELLATAITYLQERGHG